MSVNMIQSIFQLLFAVLKLEAFSALTINVLYLIWLILGATLGHQPKLLNPQLQNCWFVCVVFMLQIIPNKNISGLMKV